MKAKNKQTNSLKNNRECCKEVCPVSDREENVTPDKNPGKTESFENWSYL
jgi:hypothetical protein